MRFFLYTSRTQYTFYRDLVARTMKTSGHYVQYRACQSARCWPAQRLVILTSLQQADLAALDSAEANR
jgi:hypothetical protein